MAAIRSREFGPLTPAEVAFFTLTENLKLMRKLRAIRFAKGNEGTRFAEAVEKEATLQNFETDDEPEIHFEGQRTKSDSVVRPRGVEARTHEQWVEFFRDKITFPPNKEEQAELTIFLSPVRSVSTASFLAAVASKQFDLLWYNPFGYFARGQNHPGEQIFLGEEGQKGFMKVTIGPTEAELYDPVQILIDLGYDPDKINIIQGVRNPVETYLSIWRIGIDQMSAAEFSRMYQYVGTLFGGNTTSVVSKNRPVTLVFEVLKDFSSPERMKALMYKMFGKSFDPKFPNMTELLGMHNVHLLEADPKRFLEYFETFFVPVIKKGYYTHTTATTDEVILNLMAEHPELEDEIVEVLRMNELPYEGAKTLCFAMLGLAKKNN
jgi:hypothetical protein